MIAVNILYPSGEGTTFDLDYYIEKHMKTVHTLLEPEGMVSAEVDRGIAGVQPGAPASFTCIATLRFDSMEKFQQAFQKNGEKLVADIVNFTNVGPQIQISEVIES